VRQSPSADKPASRGIGRLDERDAGAGVDTLAALFDRNT